MCFFCLEFVSFLESVDLAFFISSGKMSSSLHVLALCHSLIKHILECFLCIGRFSRIVPSL